MRFIPLTHREAARQKNIFLPLFQKESPATSELFSYLPVRARKALLKLYQTEFKGEEGETKSIWFAEGPINRVRLFGLGEKNKWSRRKFLLAARRFVQYAKSERLKEFTVALDGLSEENKKEGVSTFSQNALLANFDFQHYKKKPKEGWPEVKTIFLAAEEKEHQHIKRNIQEGAIIGEETNACRVLANTPGSDITPLKLADAARAVAKKNSLAITVFDEKNLKRLSMGGILGVSKGSPEKPRFIIMEYHGRGASEKNPLVLVGKGVTFDTGGLSLKPDPYMYEMHMDMSGGAAVIHGMAAIARLKLPVHAVGIIPAVENMPSGTSYRPGDILKMFSGKTVEVLNTDAEGRIILGDALAYALRYKPGLMVDFATLTGAAHVALGNYCSALFTNKPQLHETLTRIGETSGDYVWPLPLWSEYAQDIKGTFADIANVAKQDRYGGAIHGAKFLEEFVGGTAWAHLDIAPRMTSHEGEYLAKGASGVGVRYIVELAREYSKLGSL